jgi:hypothetical protein
VIVRPPLPVTLDRRGDECPVIVRDVQRAGAGLRLLQRGRHGFKRVLLLGLISGVSLFGYASTSLANGLAHAAAALGIRGVITRAKVRIIRQKDWVQVRLDNLFDNHLGLGPATFVPLFIWATWMIESRFGEIFRYALPEQRQQKPG